MDSTKYIGMEVHKEATTSARDRLEDRQAEPLLEARPGTAITYGTAFATCEGRRWSIHTLKDSRAHTRRNFKEYRAGLNSLSYPPTWGFR